MQLRQLLKSKLHHARITYCEPEYMGSIEIDAALMDRAGIAEGELVHVWAVDHQARLETYALRGGKGVIGLNGGAAHYFRPGDRVVIAAFALTDEELSPRVLLLDEHNQIMPDLSPAVHR
jgi:aspartate 1-decarboxylase